MKTKVLKHGAKVTLGVTYELAKYARYSMEDYAEMLDFSEFLFSGEGSYYAIEFTDNNFFYPRFLCGDSMEGTSKLPCINPRIPKGKPCMLNSVDEAILVWGLEQIDQCVNAYQLFYANLLDEEKEGLKEIMEDHRYYRNNLR